MDLVAIGAISNSILVLALVIITRNYAKETKRQATAMENQNGMIREGLRLDRLAKQHERLVKEMTGLIGPLHSRKGEDDLFGPVIFSKKRILDEMGYHPFWQGIKENLYLAPSDLERVLNNLLIVQKDYFNIRDSTSEEQAKKMLNQHKEMLFGQLDPRYSELEKEIRRLEGELGWIE
jgi:hypothetical protein